MTTQNAIDWHNPDCLISKYFTIGEVTQNDSERIPSPGSAEEINILRMAAELDLMREAWGSAIGVTSWYRPYAINLAVGGVPDSQHITGGAVDIYPIVGDGQEFEDWLDEKWGGALGYGQFSGRGFTHIDLRGGQFESGAGEIRWYY
jgi:Peptidase M15